MFCIYRLIALLMCFSHRSHPNRRCRSANVSCFSVCYETSCLDIVRENNPKTDGERRKKRRRRENIFNYIDRMLFSVDSSASNAKSFFAKTHRYSYPHEKPLPVISKERVCIHSIRTDYRHSTHNRNRYIFEEVAAATAATRENLS